MEDNRLEGAFVEELFKACIINKSIIDLAVRELKFEYLPSESYKLIWREIVNFYEVDGKLPTIGIISQVFAKEKDEKKKSEIRNILAKVKNVRVSDVKEDVVKAFESYIKTEQFREVFNKTYDLYTDGKHDEAIHFLAENSQRVADYSITKGYYTTLFSQFDSRQLERLSKDRLEDNSKIPTGIHEIDAITKGGITKGTSWLFMGRSGTGKSTVLRWLAVNAARLGMRVVYFSLEGTKQETVDALDACFTGTPLYDIEYGDIPEKNIVKIKKSINEITSRGGEVFVYSAEQFDSMSVREARDIMIKIEKDYGKIDLACFDYLEIFETDGKFGGEAGERRRREKIANQITNIATEFNCGTATAIQAADIMPDKINNPDFVMTRHHISEFKGALKPFSAFITLNQTNDEYESGVMRLYIDKLRKARANQVVKIATAFDKARFYNARRTLELFYINERS